MNYHSRRTQNRTRTYSDTMAIVNDKDLGDMNRSEGKVGVEQSEESTKPIGAMVSSTQTIAKNETDIDMDRTGEIVSEEHSVATVSNAVDGHDDDDDDDEIADEDGESGDVDDNGGGGRRQDGGARQGDEKRGLYHSGRTLAHGTDNDGEDDGFHCQPIQQKHTEYIKNNLQTLQKKCQQFSACTQELYSAENYHSILGGESTRLTNICGLMFANGGGHYTTLKKECTEKERRAIRQTIGDKLDGKFNLGREQLNSSWVKLWKCVTDSKGDDDETVETVCRLKTSNAGNLCGDEDVNSMTRTFFNHELEHVHCSCLALESFSDQGRPRFPKPARIAIVGGVALLLVVLIIAVVVLCLRHRKTKRKLKDHKMRSVKESAARIDPEVPSAVYHEIEDVAPKLPSRPQPARGEGKLLPYGYQLGFAPPPPAERYIKGKHLPRGGSGHRSPRDDDDHRPHSYMEPLPDPIPVGLGAQGPTAAGLEGAVTSPYSLARRVEDSERADPASPSGGYSLAGRMDGVPSIVVRGAGSGSTEGTYFDTIRLSRARAEEDEFGYYAKLKSPPGGSSGDATDITTEDENHTPPEAQYFELEPQAGDAEHLERAYSALASTKL